MKILQGHTTYSYFSFDLLLQSLKIHSNSHNIHKPKPPMHTFLDLKTLLNTATHSHLTLTDFSHKNHFEIHFFTSCRSFFHTFTLKPSSPHYSGPFPSRTHRSKRHPFDTIFNAPSQSSEAHGRLRPYVDIFCPPAIVVCYISM